MGYQRTTSDRLAHEKNYWEEINQPVTNLRWASSALPDTDIPTKSLVTDRTNIHRYPQSVRKIPA